MKKVLLESVPWNTIILVSGVCMLLGVTEATGIFGSVTDILNTNLSQTAIGCILVLLGGFMSFFSGAISVVVPLFLPMVPQCPQAEAIPHSTGLRYHHRGHYDLHVPVFHGRFLCTVLSS